MFTLDDSGLLTSLIISILQQAYSTYEVYGCYDSYEFLLRLFGVNHSYACSISFSPHPPTPTTSLK